MPVSSAPPCLSFPTHRFKGSPRHRLHWVGGTCALVSPGCQAARGHRDGDRDRDRDRDKDWDRDGDGDRNRDRNRGLILPSSPIAPFLLCRAGPQEAKSSLLSCRIKPAQGWGLGVYFLPSLPVLFQYK